MLLLTLPLKRRSDLLIYRTDREGITAHVHLSSDRLSLRTSLGLSSVSLGSKQDVTSETVGTDCPALVCPVTGRESNSGVQLAACSAFLQMYP